MLGAPLEIAYEENLVRKHQDSVDGIINKIIKTQQRDREFFIKKEQKRQQEFSRFPEVKDYTYNNSVEAHLKYQDERAEKENREKIAGKENFNSKPMTDMNCEEIIKHALGCPSCKQMLIEQFQKDDSLTLKSKQNNDSLDIIIYTLSGIFLLFLMNTFIKLGRSLKKN